MLIGSGLNQGLMNDFPMMEDPSAGQAGENPQHSARGRTRGTGRFLRADATPVRGEETRALSNT
jgi:hypothetical protein